MEHQTPGGWGNPRHETQRQSKAVNRVVGFGSGQQNSAQTMRVYKMLLAKQRWGKGGGEH